MVLPDVVLLYIALWISISVRYPGGLNAQQLQIHITSFSILYAVWMLVFYIHSLFDVRVFRRYTSVFINLVSAMVINLLLSIVYFYFQPSFIITPRRFLLLDIGVVFVLMLMWHLLVKYVLKNRLTQGVYLFSFNNELADLEREIGGHTYLGYRVLGHLNETTLQQTGFNRNASIILPENLQARPDVLRRFYELRTLGANFLNSREFYESLLRRVYISELSEAWFLENIDYREKRWYGFFKRVIDIVAGIVALVVFVVTYPLLAILIKLSSPGPILFTQERVGKHGRIFRIYKYRTMSGGRTDTWTEKNDPRITKIGNIFRKTRLDELPQAINLIRGDLSLVGPRPEQTHIVEQLREQIPFYDERHLVKPGITGWAQLNIYAGSLEETKLKLQYDLYYIKRRSLLFDLEIILKTIYYIFTWQGR